MKKLLAPFMLGFGIALAVVIGKRFSVDAQAVLIGVAVGIAASVPVSVLLIALMRKDYTPPAPKPHVEVLPPPDGPRVYWINPELGPWVESRPLPRSDRNGGGRS